MLNKHFFIPLTCQGDFLIHINLTVSKFCFGSGNLGFLIYHLELTFMVDNCEVVSTIIKGPYMLNSSHNFIFLLMPPNHFDLEVSSHINGTSVLPEPFCDWVMYTSLYRDNQNVGGYKDISRLGGQKLVFARQSGANRSFLPFFKSGLNFLG